MAASPSLRRIAVCLALIALAVSCGDKKDKPETAEDVPALSDKAGGCSSNADCQAGWVCLSGQCSDPTVRGLGAGNGVTPDKVKKQVEDVAKKADERGQKALDL